MSHATAPQKASFPISLPPLIIRQKGSLYTRACWRKAVEKKEGEREERDAWRSLSLSLFGSGASADESARERERESFLLKHTFLPSFLVLSLSLLSLSLKIGEPRGRRLNMRLKMSSSLSLSLSALQM